MKNQQKQHATGTLLLSCPDQKGVVAAVSQFIFTHQGNILHADQHTDTEKNVFLQRVEWELEGFDIPRNRIGEAFSPIGKKFGMRWELRFSDFVPRVAILVSAQAHCMYDLFARHRMGEFQADFPLVISNHTDLAPIASECKATFHHFDITHETKVATEQKMVELLRQERIDLVVLARYMRILGNEFVSAFENRIINIHHSFLPAFAGAQPYHQAFARGVKIIGATAHYVTPELDQGPIIEQDVVRISHRDSVDNLIRKGRDLEKTVLAHAVGLHLANRVLAYDNKTVVFD